MMNYQNKTKDELIKDMRILQKQYDSLKRSYEKEISESRLIEFALRESEERYRLLFENSSEAFLLTNPDGSIYSANPEACRIFGMSEDEICKSGRTSVVDLNDPRLKLALKERKKTGKFKGELFLLRKDGTKFSAELTSNVFRDSSGNERTSMIVRDVSERKKIQEGLIQALDWQHAIFEGSRDAIFISDPESRFIAVNNAACDLTGYSREQLLSMKIPDLHDKSDLEAFMTYNKRIFDGEETISEAKILRRDGVKVDMEFNNRSVSISGQQYMHTTARDISGRKLKAEALKQSELRFQQISENSGIWIWEVDKNGLYTYSSPIIKEILGYEPEEIINRKYFYDLFNPEFREKLKHEAFEAFGRKESFRNFVNSNIHKDGREVILSTSGIPVLDIEGNLIGYRGADTDITQRKKMEEELLASSLYTRNLIEASLDPLVTISIEGKITDVNFALEQITGIDRKKLIGSDFEAYVTEPDKAMEGFRIVLSKGAVKDYHLTIIHTSGRTIDVLFNATLFKNEAGEVMGVFAAAHDITDIKKMEKELRNSKELLEKLNQHLNEIRENERTMISREIHDEVGQSMTALKLDLNLLYKYLNNNPEAVMKLGNMIKLISITIKNVQRISSDLRPSILDDLGLVSAIEWYCDEFEKRTGIKCYLELDNSDYNDTLINLVFFRVLQETLTNVIRHARASSVKVRLHQSPKGSTMTVLDDGIGISEENIESHKSLGLISIRERVRQFNGKVDISSKEGVGTELTIFIPL